MDVLKAGLVEARTTVAYDRMMHRVTERDPALMTLLGQRAETLKARGYSRGQARGALGADFMDRAAAFALDPRNGLPPAARELATRMRARHAAARAAGTEADAARRAKRPMSRTPVVPAGEQAAPALPRIDVAAMRTALRIGALASLEGQLAGMRAARAVTAALAGEPTAPKTFHVVTRNGGQRPAIGA